MNAGASPVNIRTVPSTTLITIGDQDLRMTPQMHGLLVFLLTRPGRIFTKRELLRAISDEAEYKLVDVQICHIRRALREAFPDPDNPCPIQINNHWGLGTSLTYGPYDAPHSNTRWTPKRKTAFLLALNVYDPESNPHSYDHFRSQYPEITDEMIALWQDEDHGVIECA